MKPPTARQLELLRFCADRVAKRGAFPALVHIADHFGWSSGQVVWNRLRIIQDHGLVTISADSRGKMRGRLITERGWRVLGITRPVFTASREVTGTVEPLATRCLPCSRVFFGDAYQRHVCAAKDISVAS